jgi:hypothetical protein
MNISDSDDLFLEFRAHEREDSGFEDYVDFLEWKVAQVQMAHAATLRVYAKLVNILGEKDD